MQEKQPVSMKLEKNERWMREQCRDCADIKFRPMKLGRESSLSCLMVYIEVTVDNVMLQNSLLGQLVNRLWEMPREDLKMLRDLRLGLFNVFCQFFNFRVQVVTSILLRLSLIHIYPVRSAPHV